ncbi:MAG: pilus assembly protein PilP [Rhodanobacter sp.]|jgi:type IV pilus assembly protein PilP|nr:pilus assembly protein PilP [Rhodanobacter sp.]
MKTSLTSHACRLTAICMLLVGLLGCTASDDVHQWVAQEKAKKGAPLKPLPVVKTFETFLYKDKALRDPFGPGAGEQDQTASNGPRPEEHVREPLESFPLDGLKMSGTLGTDKQMEGLIRDTDGVIHRVRVGNYLGQNYGRVTAINDDHIDIVELVPNGTGGWMERQASIALGDAKK